MVGTASRGKVAGNSANVPASTIGRGPEEAENTRVVRLNAEMEFNGMKYFESESSGADNEVAHANLHGLPVFHDIEPLIEWANGNQH